METVALIKNNRQRITKAQRRHAVGALVEHLSITHGLPLRRGRTDSALLRTTSKTGKPTEGSFRDSLNATLKQLDLAPDGHLTSFPLKAKRRSDGSAVHLIAHAVDLAHYLLSHHPKLRSLRQAAPTPSSIEKAHLEFRKRLR